VFYHQWEQEMTFHSFLPEAGLVIKVGFPILHFCNYSFSYQDIAVQFKMTDCSSGSKLMHLFI